MSDDTTAQPWREALARWPSSGYTWGDTIPHAWFYEAFGLEQPTDMTPMKEAEALRWKLVNQLDSFSRALLEVHHMDLASVRGVGYEIVRPADAARRAFDEGVSSIKRIIRETLMRIRYAPLAQLTDDQRREQADLYSRAAGYAAFFRGTVRPSYEDGEA